MATHTVYGCINPTTKEFEFDETYEGCEGLTISACIVGSGEHKGDIKIIHEYEGCETDVYYACVDESTGLFSYEADDECCGEYDSDESECCGIGCTSMPRYLKLTLNSVGSCSCPAGKDCDSLVGSTAIIEHDTQGGSCFYSAVVDDTYWSFNKIGSYISVMISDGVPGGTRCFCIYSGISYPRYYWNDSEYDNCSPCKNMPITITVTSGDAGTTCFPVSATIGFV